MLFELIFNSRSKAQMDPATIRQRLTLLTDRRTAMVADRQRLALPEAEGDQEAAARRVSLDGEVVAIDRQIAILEDAQPAARARERDEQRREGQQIIADLTAQYDEIVPQRDALLDAMKQLSSVPSRGELEALFLLGRDARTLAGVLLQATGDARFANPPDVIDQLRWHWHVQRQERDRLLERFKAARPSRPARAWQEQVARLRALEQRAS